MLVVGDKVTLEAEASDAIEAIEALAWETEAMRAEALEAAAADILETEAKAAETLAEAWDMIEETFTVGVAVTV